MKRDSSDSAIIQRQTGGNYQILLI